jgi:hypothetical protein
MKKTNNMKKIAFIVLLGLSFALHAQRGKGKQQERNEYTPEQRAVLKTKKMALHLDLNEDQQKKLIEVNRKWGEKRAKEREEFKAQFEGDERPDADARYKQELQMLDNRMAYQKEVEKILSKDQYATWKEHQEKRSKGHARGKGRGKPHDRDKRES